MTNAAENRPSPFVVPMWSGLVASGWHQPLLRTITSISKCLPEECGGGPLCARVLLLQCSLWISLIYYQIAEYMYALYRKSVGMRTRGDRFNTRDIGYISEDIYPLSGLQQQMISTTQPALLPTEPLYIYIYVRTHTITALQICRLFLPFFFILSSFRSLLRKLFRTSEYLSSGPTWSPTESSKDRRVYNFIRVPSYRETEWSPETQQPLFCFKIEARAGPVFPCGVFPLSVVLLHAGRPQPRVHCVTAPACSACRVMDQSPAFPVHVPCTLNCVEPRQTSPGSVPSASSTRSRQATRKAGALFAWTV
jgi:hypothetical protein